MFGAAIVCPHAQKSREHGRVLIPAQVGRHTPEDQPPSEKLPRPRAVQSFPSSEKQSGLGRVGPPVPNRAPTTDQPVARHWLTCPATVSLGGTSATTCRCQVPTPRGGSRAVLAAIASSRHLAAVPPAYLRALGADPAVFGQLPLPLRRRVWEADVLRWRQDVLRFLKAGAGAAALGLGFTRAFFLPGVPRR